MINKYDKIIYENEKGERLEFSPNLPLYLVNANGIDGLKNTFSTSRTIGQVGATLNSKLVEPRTVSLELAITEDVEEYRKKLFKIINPMYKGKLIYTNNLDEKQPRYLDVVVEQAPLITKDFQPRVLIQLVAHQPFWYSNYQSIQVAYWQGDFEFELEIERDNPQDQLMGHRSENLIAKIVNDGDVETGFTIEFIANNPVKNPMLFDVETRKFIKINKDMVAGEIIRVNTKYGEKKIEQILNGETKNIFNLLDEDSTFLQLNYGTNFYRYDAQHGIENLDITIYFNHLYSGV